MLLPPLAWLLLKEASSGDIQPLTWTRMLFAELPWTFGFEVVVRSLIIFAYSIVALRLLGKRGVARLSPFEFAILLAFGSLIGDPSFYHDVGLVFAMIAVATIVFLYRALAWLTARSSRVAALAESTPRQLVCRGLLDHKGMRSERISHADIFELLRENGVRHLGEVDFAYLEPSGQLSTFRFPAGEHLPGLPIVPPIEVTRPGVFRQGEPVLLEGYHACCNCGLTSFLLAGKSFERCNNCSEDKWVVAATGSKGS